MYHVQERKKLLTFVIVHASTRLQERKKLLTFVIVGGGPTGVEVAAELHDMIEEDLSKLYPTIYKDVRRSGLTRMFSHTMRDSASLPGLVLSSHLPSDPFETR
jgi:hypothetical protein